MKLIYSTTLSLALLGCGGSDSDQDGGVLDLGGDATDGAANQCQEPRALDCVDQIIQDLSLHDDKVSSGQVSNTPSGGDWLTLVDATAGGFGQENNNPWVYVRFEDDGAVRVDIDDETALGDMTWHLAARRYVIRTNGGSSGPGCVAAAAMPQTDYQAITQLPEDITLEGDDFYSEACSILDDGSGLPGSPKTATRDWWVYDDCVKTSRIPYVMILDGERAIKLVVEAYYATGQEECNTTNVPGTDGGTYTWRWRFLN